MSTSSLLAPRSLLWCTDRVSLQAWCPSKPCRLLVYIASRDKPSCTAPRYEIAGDTRIVLRREESTDHGGY